jgi:hypothetical protein
MQRAVAARPASGTAAGLLFLPAPRGCAVRWRWAANFGNDLSD